MTINKIQNHSFTEKLRKADNRMNIDSTKGPQVVKQGIRIEANSIREAQKSKDGLSYMPQNQYNINDDLYSKSQSTGTTAYMYHESNKKLNNSNQKTAKINFRGLSNSAAGAAKALTETRAWKFSQNSAVKWFVNKAATNQAVFEALNALVITCALRPTAILAQNNDKNREKNKKAASHSIASGIIGYGFAVALFTPVAKGLKKIKENPEKYAKRAQDFFRKVGNKKVSMEASKRFATFTMLCTYGPQLFTAAVRSAVTIGMIPYIDKYLLNPILGTKPAKKQDSTVKDPMYSYYYLNFTSNPKKTFQNFTGVMK